VFLNVLLGSSAVCQSRVGKYIVTEPRAVATGPLLKLSVDNKRPVATARGSVTTALFSYLLLIGTLNLNFNNVLANEYAKDV